MITPQQFLKLTKTDDESIYKIGTVETINSEGNARIKFDGENSISEKGYVSVGYTPSPNDRVLLTKVSGTYVILGEIGGAGGGDMLVNLDGGKPDSIYGGFPAIDGGGI